MWYQHDEYPAHFSLVTRNKFNKKFANRWNGRGSCIDQLVHQIPLDFLLGLQRIQSIKKNQLPQGMQQRIITTYALIISEIIKD